MAAESDWHDISSDLDETQLDQSDGQMRQGHILHRVERTHACTKNQKNDSHVECDYLIWLEKRK
jgi:hypothetical protein